VRLGHLHPDHQELDLHLHHREVQVLEVVQVQPGDLQVQVHAVLQVVQQLAEAVVHQFDLPLVQQEVLQEEINTFTRIKIK
jgi:2-phospho-L-lactate guanylyltransferase (CobY/MobA/RfbA family)